MSRFNIQSILHFTSYTLRKFNTRCMIMILSIHLCAFTSLLPKIKKKRKSFANKLCLTSYGSTRCFWAQVVIALINYVFFTKWWASPHPCLWTTELFKDAPFHTTRPSPITNEPVDLWDVPNRCFRALYNFQILWNISEEMFILNISAKYWLMMFSSWFSCSVCFSNTISTRSS